MVLFLPAHGLHCYNGHRGNMNKEIIQTFLRYIESQKEVGLDVRMFSENGEEHAEIKAEHACGVVVIHAIEGNAVVELQVRNLHTDEVVFYLHFELQEIGHAKELFDEMMKALKSLKQQKKSKVLLCCTSGLTTSYFVMKLQEAVRVLGLDMEFRAVDYNRLFVCGFKCDAVLLAPQIGYMHDKVKEILMTCPVAVVPAGIFGAYDVGGLLEFAGKTLDRREHDHQQRVSRVKEKTFFREDALCVAVFLEDRSVRIVYRIYHDGVSVTTGQVLKKSYRLRDLEDLLDVVLKGHPEIRYVIVCTPGVLHEGRLTFRQPRICNVEVKHRFEDRYRRNFCFINDADAMALGFSGMTEGMEDICFYFHPLASRTSGIGSVVKGMLLEGAHGIGGEMQYISGLIRYSKDPAKLAMTPEGTLEIVAKYLTIAIAELDPSCIAVCCSMVPDMEDLRRAIGSYIRPQFIPKLVKVPDPLPYMFAGGMMKAHDTWCDEG